jgi:DNA gyrase subunit B
MSLVHRLSHGYSEEVLEGLIDYEPLDLALFEDQTALTQWWQGLETHLNLISKETTRFEFEVRRDEEHSQTLLVACIYRHSVRSEYIFDSVFFSSSEYRQLLKLGALLKGMIEPRVSVVHRGEKNRVVSHFGEVIDFLLEEARRGQNIQRYKGLGEMNSDQLWETTMNPAARTLLQVSIADAVAADGLFNTLMGDNVEPRRLFIEDNALKVKNLDI